MTGRETQSAVEEGRMLIRAIAEDLPRVIDARAAVASMKEGGSKHWRQMEWIGFYPEFWFENGLAISFDASPGPRFGNMAFDIQRKHVWDLKAHAEGSSTWAPLNDDEAVTGCIAEYGGVGFLVLSGPCSYDTDGTFKSWHDSLKGGPSEYSNRIAAREAVSRRRKISFRPNHLIAFRFESVQDLERARKDGWIKAFQKGMRNSNDNQRRAKIMVDLSRIGSWALIEEIYR